jgi:lipopolysaccharide transport system ATP-binding protein
MSDIAIRAERLGKHFLLGQHRDYTDLRQSLTGAIRAPFFGLTSVWKSRSAMANVQLSNRHIWALRDVSFDVKYGEVIGILGDNGGGKTTVLKILSRITEPTEGYAEVRGRVGTLLDVGAGLHGELTGRENVYLNGAVKGMTRVEIKRKFDEIVDFAELDSFIDTPLKYYSSGMCVRLAFAVAVHLESEILLVDEVLAQADSTFQRKCLEKMVNAVREGRSVLFVSHDVECVRRLCNRGMVFARGRMAYSGPASEAVDYYSSVSGKQLCPGPGPADLAHALQER